MKLHAKALVNLMSVVLMVFLVSGLAALSLPSPVTAVPPAPTLVSPASGAVVNGNSIDFSWDAAAGATDYDLYIWSSSGTFYDSWVGNVTTRTVNGFLNDGRAFYWRVYPKDGSGIGPASATWNFKNGLTPNPANGAVVSGGSIGFTWNAVPGATDYDLYIWSAAGTLFDRWLGNVTSFTVSSFPDDGRTFNWRVYPKVGGAIGPSSATFSFNNGLARNPMQIAMLRWYEAIQTGTTFGVGSNPSSCCFDGSSIWVANYLSANVSKLNAIDGTALGGPYAVGRQPWDICFDGANVWTTNWADSNVSKLRASDGVVLGTYFVGAGLRGICFDGSNIWVTISLSNTVAKLRANDGLLVGGPFSVGSLPTGICFDGTNIWVTNMTSSTVSKLRASDGSLLGTYSVGSQPFGICFDGANVWVANSGGTDVSKLRVSDGATVGGPYTVGANPRDVCYDGANIWVANWGSSTVSKLRASDGTVLGTYNVGTNPNGICFDGANAWVTNYNSNTVSKL